MKFVLLKGGPLDGQRREVGDGEKRVCFSYAVRFGRYVPVIYEDTGEIHVASIAEAFRHVFAFTGQQPRWFIENDAEMITKNAIEKAKGNRDEC